MIISPHEQGTDAWLAARLGKPSASCFSKLITMTGKPSSSADGYINLLLAERLTGKSEPHYTSEAMILGTEREPEARADYEFITGNKVDQFGFILNESQSYGCSPDGLVGDDGGLELKCPAQTTQAGYWRDPQSGVKKYYQQIQGCMWVTGRKWWDFFSYHPDMPHVLVRVKRDQDYIDKLSEQVLLATSTIETEMEKRKWQ
jgi:hypothetical protein